MELRDFAAVQEEAARSLAEMARDEVRQVADPKKNRHMAIEVRDDNGPPLEVNFTFRSTRRGKVASVGGIFHSRNLDSVSWC